MPADVLGAARAAVGDEAVDRALADGRAMDIQRAAEYALSEG
jgi:hypothetical protein